MPSKKESERTKNSTDALFAGMKPFDDNIPGQMDIEDYPEAAPDKPNAEIPNDQPKQTRKASQKPQGKDKEDKTDKTAFSAWISKDDISKWDRYITIAGITRAKLTETAINEYIRKHPLTAEQKQKYLESMELL